MSESSHPELDRASRMPMDLSVELGRIRIAISQILDWTEGTLIELDLFSGDPVKVRVNNVPFAEGEVVTVGEKLEKLGVRIVDIDQDAQTE